MPYTTEQQDIMIKHFSRLDRFINDATYANILDTIVAMDTRVCPNTSQVISRYSNATEVPQHRILSYLHDLKRPGHVHEHNFDALCEDSGITIDCSPSSELILRTRLQYYRKSYLDLIQSHGLYDRFFDFVDASGTTSSADKHEKEHMVRNFIRLVPDHDTRLYMYTQLRSNELIRRDLDKTIDVLLKFLVARSEVHTTNYHAYEDTKYPAFRGLSKPSDMHDDVSTSSPVATHNSAPVTTPVTSAAAPPPIVIPDASRADTKVAVTPVTTISPHSRRYDRHKRSSYRRNQQYDQHSSRSRYRSNYGPTSRASSNSGYDTAASGDTSGVTTDTSYDSGVWTTDDEGYNTDAPRHSTPRIRRGTPKHVTFKDNRRRDNRHYHRKDRHADGYYMRRGHHHIMKAKVPSDDSVVIATLDSIDGISSPVIDKVLLDTGNLTNFPTISNALIATMETIRGCPLPRRSVPVMETTGFNPLHSPETLTDAVDVQITLPASIGTPLTFQVTCYVTPFESTAAPVILDHASLRVLKLVDFKAAIDASAQSFKTMVDLTY